MAVAALGCSLGIEDSNWDGAVRTSDSRELDLAYEVNLMRQQGMDAEDFQVMPAFRMEVFLASEV